MGKRIIIDEDTDDGSGAIIGLIVGIVVIGILLYVAIWVGVIFGVGYGIYRLVKYVKKQKKMEPLRCPKCHKKNALEHFESRVIRQQPVSMNVFNKRTRKNEAIIMEAVITRKYEKCKYCGEIIFSDIITREIPK